jgi:hypothetical protein
MQLRIAPLALGHVGESSPRGQMKSEKPALCGLFLLDVPTAGPFSENMVSGLPDQKLKPTRLYGR